MNKLSSLKFFYPLLLLTFFLLAYIVGIGARDLLVPDETRYAEIPREMIASGDWVVPHLNGLRYFEKPVFGYWVHASSLLAFGNSEFAIRLPSSLAVGASALLIYLLVLKILTCDVEKRRENAFLAAFVYLSSAAVFGIGNVVVLDSVFSLIITCTIVSFFLATEAAHNSWKEKCLLVLSGICCGASFLTKGLLAFAVPVLVITPYLAWQRRFSDIVRMCWLPIVTAVLTALPWCVMVHIKEPDFWNYLFWTEHVKRFFSVKAQHKEPMWFFLSSLPALCLPWTAILPACLLGQKEKSNTDERGSRLFRLSLCWFIFPLLLFSFSQGKLLTYILPCFPPFSILVAMSWVRVRSTVFNRKLVSFGIGVVLSLLVVLLIVFCIFQTFGFKGVRPYSDARQVTIVVCGLVSMSILCFLAFRQPVNSRRVILLGVAPLLLYCGAHYAVPDMTLAIKAPGLLITQHRDKFGKDDMIVADEDSAAAIGWFLQRNDMYITGPPGELRYGLDYEQSRYRQLDSDGIRELINTHPGRVILFLRERKGRFQLDALPAPVFTARTAANEGYLLMKF